MMDDLRGIQLLVALLLLVGGPGGAAWIATKISLNGARDDIRDMKQELHKTSEIVIRLEAWHHDHSRRIENLEKR